MGEYNNRFHWARQTKKASADTPDRASAEAFSVSVQEEKRAEIDPYPDILRITSADVKTYGAILLHSLQRKKSLIFDPFHDTKTDLSVIAGSL